MSVVKSKRGHGELECLTKARELKIHTLRICANTNNFPKRYRWCLTNDIIRECCELCRLITTANAIKLDKKEFYEYKRRLHTQRLALEMTEVILEDIDTAYYFLHLDSDKVECWTGLVVNVQDLLHRWIRSDEKRIQAVRDSFCKSPNVGNANNVRNVNTSGANDNNNANNSNGVAPDFSKQLVYSKPIRRK